MPLQQWGALWTLESKGIRMASTISTACWDLISKMAESQPLQEIGWVIGSNPRGSHLQIGLKRGHPLCGSGIALEAGRRRSPGRGMGRVPHGLPDAVLIVASATGPVEVSQ